MRIYSELTKQYYDKEETVSIKNTKQAGLYMKYGVFPVDIYWEEESDVLVFIFSKRETKNLYQMWKNYCLE